MDCFAETFKGRVRALRSAGRCVSAVLAVFIATAALAQAAAPPPTADVLVRLASGDSIRGTIVERTSSSIVLRHAVLGTLTIPNADVVELQPIVAKGAATATAAGQSAAADTAAAVAPATGLAADTAAATGAGAGASPSATADGSTTPTAAAEKPKSPWSARIAAAVNYTDNNDTTIDARLAAGAEYKIEDVETLALDAEYYFKTLNSNTTDNNLLVSGVYDRYIERSPWLWFVKAQYQYSQFEAWEHRVSGYAGIGYQFFEEPPIDLLVKIGAGGTYEIGPPSDTQPEGYAEAQFGWDISKLQRLEISSNIAPELTDFGEFRIISRAEWQLRIDPDLDLKLIFGLRSQYQSQVPAGDVNHDFRLYAGVQLGF